LGIFWLVAFVMAVAITANAEPEPPPILLFGIFWLVDFVLLAAMSRADFNIKYNTAPEEGSRGLRRRKRRESLSERRSAPTYRDSQRPVQDARSTWRERQPAPAAFTRKSTPRNPALIKGVRLYKGGDYEHAIDAFEEALDIEPGSPAALFNIACSYSMLNEASSAYAYLSLAVENGFSDFAKLEQHQALQYLRDRTDYRAFVDNGYKVVGQLPEPQADLIEELQNFNPSILDKIEVLGEKLESGELSREEFEAEKRKILGHED
jgi:tetratricopeptide (TPR) repeat protein